MIRVMLNKKIKQFISLLLIFVLIAIPLSFPQPVRAVDQVRTDGALQNLESGTSDKLVDLDHQNNAEDGQTGAISNVTVQNAAGTDHHSFGTEEEIAVTVSTSNVPDGNDLTVSLVDHNKLTVNTVASDSGTLANHKADLTLAIPAGQAAGSYFVEVAIQNIGGRVYQGYTISPGGSIPEESAAADIIDFTVENQVGEAVVDPDAQTVTFLMPYGSDITALTPTINVSANATLSPASQMPQDFSGPVIYTVTAEGGAQKEWTISCSIYSKKSIIDFTVPNQVGEAFVFEEGSLHMVSFRVPYGTDVTNLAPTITVSPGAAISPASQTAQDFSSPFTYTVTAADDSEQLWRVFCTVEPGIIGFTVPNQVGASLINGVNHTVSFHMPYGSDVTALKPLIHVSDDKPILPASDTEQDFTSPVEYTLTADDDTEQIWTVTCIVDPEQDKKPQPAVTLNPTGNFKETNQNVEVSIAGVGVGEGTTLSVTLVDSNYTPVQNFGTFNCSVASNAAHLNLSLPSTLDAGNYYVEVSAPGMDTAYQAYKIYQMPTLALSSLSHAVGVAANVNVQVTASELNDGTAVTASLADHNKLTVNTVASDSGTLANHKADLTLAIPAGQAAGSYFVEVAIQNIGGRVYQGYTISPGGSIPEESAAADIIDFTVENQVGEAVVDPDAQTVTFLMPYGSDITALTPTINVSANATLSPASQMPRDFSSPVIYIVTAEGGAQKEWTISCSIYSKKSIINFTVPNQVGDALVVEEGFPRVYFRVPYGTDITNLAPTITVSPGAAISPASQTAQDFSSPFTYTVTAADDSEQLWRVFCTVEPGIIGFTVPNQVGASLINGVNHTVSFHMPYGSDVTALKPLIHVSDDKPILPASGTEQDFTSPVEYTLTADDDTEQIWTVTCIVDPGQDKKPQSKTPIINKPAVSTKPVSDLSLTKATLNGLIVKNGGEPASRVNFRYRIKGAAGWQNTDIKQVSLDAQEEFSALVSGLKPNMRYEYLARAYNSAGWGEGQIEEFTTTAVALPQVVTNAAAAVNAESAALQGAITDIGGAALTDSGFLWGIFDKNGLDLKKVQVTPAKDDSLTLDLTGLTKNTQYYFQAYATNETGTGYGELLSVRTLPDAIFEVITLEVAEVGPTTATLRGKATGGVTLSDSGFDFGPGFSGEIHIAPADDGSFSLTLNNLQPSTTYHYTAYAKNATGIKYGSPVLFSTLSGRPEVETQPCSELTSTSVTLNGKVTDYYGFAISDTGFLWGTSPYPENKMSLPPGPDLTHRSALTNLQSGATYYAQAYAVTSAGTGYGEVISFTLPAAIPTVTTQQPVSDGLNIWQADLAGQIVAGGGAPITEYGFMYKTQWVGDPWKKLQVGTEDHLGMITARLNAQPLNNSSAYYIVRTYAVNVAGAGYGEIFSIPRLPIVYGSIDSSSITESSAILKGDIVLQTEGAYCTERGFQYRRAGEGTWRNVGMEQGTFGNGEYSFELTGLIPAVNYEFRPMASNAAGWSNSWGYPFTTNYGATDKEAAVNMRNAGYSGTEIANVLKSVYNDTPVAAIQALRYAEFSVENIAAAMKGSVYYTRDNGYYSACQEAGWLKEAGFDSSAVTVALQKVFPSETLFNSRYANHPDWGIVSVLVWVGYGIDEIAVALRGVAGSNAATAASALVGGGNFRFHDDGDFLQAINKAYGVDELAKWLWQGPYPMYTYSRPGVASDFVYNMKRSGIDPIQTAELLKKLKPELSSEECAKAFLDKYSAADTASTLVQVFAADAYSVGYALTTAGYRPEDIKNVLIHNLHCEAREMARLMTAYWERPYSSVPEVLINDYKLEALEFAKILYAVGWTEANNGRGPKNDSCGLWTVISALVEKYNLKAPGDIIGILRELGFSPLGVAQMMSSTGGLFRTSRDDYFLPAYRQQGYTATDAALWGQSSGYKTVATTIDLLLSIGGYGLKDTVLAVRNIYKPDAAAALRAFVDNNRLFRWGLANNDITQAVSEVYSEDPVLAVCWTMKNAGAPAIQTAGTLKNTLNTSDPFPIATYLAQVGYGQSEVLYALAGVFANANDRENTVQLFRMLAEILETVYQAPPLDSIRELLLLAGVTTPEGAILTLKQMGYDLHVIVLNLKDTYQTTAFQAIALLTKSGFYKQEEILAWVQTVYGVDPILAQLQAIKSRGSQASSGLSFLRGSGVNEPSAQAHYLFQAGYGQKDVLEALVNRYQPSAAAIKMLDQVVKNVYPEEPNSLKTVLGIFGMTDPEGAAQSLRKAAGYPINEIAVTLKEAYNCSAGEVIEVLRSGYPMAEVLQTVQAVFPGIDCIVSYIIYEKEKRGDDASLSYSSLQEIGIKDPLKIFGYLKEAGYSKEQMVEVVLDRSSKSMSVVLKNLYGLTDAVAMAKLYNEEAALYNNFGLGVFDNSVTVQLQAAFPELDTAGVALVLQAAGYPVDINKQGRLKKGLSSGEDLTRWLRDLARLEKGNDALAAVLGPGKLDVDVYWAREILQSEGYSPLEIGKWLKQDGYSPAMVLYGLTSVYGEGRVQCFKSLSTMRDIGYGINDLVKAEADLQDQNDNPYIWPLYDLVNLGYSFEQLTQAYVAVGGPLNKLPLALWSASTKYFHENFDYVVASGLYYHHLSGEVVATYMYNAVKAAGRKDVTLVDIARGFLNTPKNHYSESEILSGMRVVAGMFLQDELRKQGAGTILGIDISSLKVTDSTALYILRQAGQSIDDAVTALRKDGNSWSEALGTLMGAGYSFSDSMSALWSQYKNAMGADIISVMSSAGKVAVDPGIVGIVKVIGQLSLTGFKIGTAE